MAQDVSFLGELFKTVGSGLEERRKQKGIPLDIFELMLKQKQLERLSQEDKVQEEAIRSAIAKRLEEEKELKRLTSPVTSVQTSLAKQLGFNLPLSTTQQEYERVLGPLSSLTRVRENITEKPISEAVSEAYTNAEDALKSVRQVKSMVTKPGGLRKLGIATGIPYGLGSRELKFELDNISDILLRLRSGAAINQQEYDRLRGLLPTIQDVIESKSKNDLSLVNRKLDKFEGSFANILKRLEIGRPKIKGAGQLQQEDNDPMKLGF